MVNNEYYGVLPQKVITSSLDKNMEELAILGYTVIEDVIGAEELQELRDKLDAAYKVQQEEVRPDYELEDIQEENQVRGPLCYNDHFIEIAKNDRVIEVIRATLGSYFLIHLQIGIINQPSTPNRQAVWHRDLLYQDFVISRPLAISVMLCIDDFNEETGGTIVVPYSHKLERMPSNEFIQKTGVTINAKAGSVFLMDSMLIHKAGYNTSGRIRRGLNTIYASGIVKQQISFQSQLDGKFREDPFLNMLLGYDAEASKSVADWRHRRHNKLYGNK